MIGSAQHSLAKWLTSILDPVLLLYFTNCIQDSFTFAQRIRQFDLPLLLSFALLIYPVFLLMFPWQKPLIFVLTLFIVVTFKAQSFPREVFIEVMQTATKCVEFSFNNVMYRQIDGVAMGSLLRPALVNIFIGYYEPLLFRRVKKLVMSAVLQNFYGLSTVCPLKILRSTVCLLSSLRSTLEK